MSPIDRRALMWSLAIAGPGVGVLAQRAEQAPSGGPDRLPGGGGGGGGGRRTLLDYLPEAQRPGALAGTDRSTDHSDSLQAMLDEGVEDIELGRGSFNLRKPIRLRGNARWRGRGGSTVLRSGVDGYLVETAATGRRLGLEDLVIEGDLANSRSGGFKLFDPATYHVRGVSFRNFSREALRLVQGVLVAVEDCTFVNCGNSKAAAVFLDPGSTSSVLGIIDRCYFASCATGLAATTCRMLHVNDTVFETCRVATSFTGVDGLFSNSWLEANDLDGDWTDCSGLHRVRVLSTNAPSGRWRLRRSGRPGAPSTGVTSEMAVAEMHNSDIRVAVVGRWTDVLFDTAGGAHEAIPLDGGDPAVLRCGPRGYYRAEFRVQLRNRGSVARHAAIRLVADSGSGYAEVAGSYGEATVEPGGSMPLSCAAQVHLPRDARLKLQWTVDHPEVVLASGGMASLASPSRATNAHLAVRHLGIEA